MAEQQHTDTNGKPSQARINQALTKEAAQLAQQDFPRYKQQLIGWATIGYLFVFLLLFLFIGVLGGIAALAYFGPALLVLLLKKKLIFLLIPAIWLLARALWVKFDPPPGLRLRRRDFPALYGELDQICKQLDARKVHQVVITDEFNAAIVQTPRLGILGWQKNTLILGLELLMILPTQQARAVIAHELGHLSGNHSRFNGWIYRVRMTWLRIMYSFAEQQGIAARMMTKFFDWYAPRFAAYSYPLAQINEYEADKVAAELTDAQTTADALINTTANAPYVDEHYWSEFFKQADHQPQPPSMPWHGLQQFIETHAIDREKLQQNLNKILKRQTSFEDTHPSLTDRLNALGAEAKLPQDQDDNAAHFWLGEQLDAIITDFDQVWLNNNQQGWQQRYQFAHQSNEQLTKLRQQDVAKLTLDDVKQLANLENQFGDSEKAKQLLQQYHQLHPNDADIAFILGEIAFQQDDAKVLDLMKIALQSPQIALPACDYAYRYLINHNRRDECLWWEEQAEKFDEYQQNAIYERQVLPDDAEIKSVTLAQSQIDELIEKLKHCGKVKKAWIGERVMNYFPQEKCIVIVYISKGFALSADKQAAKIIEHIDTKEYSFFITEKKSNTQVVKDVIKLNLRII